MATKRNVSAVPAGIPGVQRSGRFEEQDLAFGCGHRFVFHAFGNYVHLAGAEPHGAVPQLDGQAAPVYPEQLIGFRV